MESKKWIEWTGKESPKKSEVSISELIPWKILFSYLTALIVISIFSLSHAGAPPPGWRQVNRDGFISGFGPNNETDLFVFNEELYAFNGNGLFRMNNPLTRNWTKLSLPYPPFARGQLPSQLIVLGGFLYASYNGELWLLQDGNDPAGPDWHKLYIAPDSLTLKTIFADMIYGVKQISQGFEIWRAPLGVYDNTLWERWERVVDNSFGDTANNTSVDIMIVYNGDIYAGVGTLDGFFGDPRSYGTGVEIWESSTGSLNTWSQVNVDGFGTLFQGCINPGPMHVCYFAIHQVIGSAAVYRAGRGATPYLYIGTKSHYGAEIWRYNGVGGVNGWTNVTPSWAGPGFTSSPGRNEDLGIFSGGLYLAEGFPTANLAKYDGTNWSIVVAGPEVSGLPHTFSPRITRLHSLAVYKDKIYVSAAGNIYDTLGDQVWGYPFKGFIVPVYMPLLLD